MQVVKVITTEDGGSRFVEINVEQREAAYTQNVPPLLVSQLLPAQGVVFVTTPDDLRDTRAASGAATSVRRSA